MASGAPAQSTITRPKKPLQVDKSPVAIKAEQPTEESVFDIPERVDVGKVPLGVDPRRPLKGCEDCFDQALSLEARVGKINIILGHLDGFKIDWQEKGSPACDVCGKSHPPPCWESEQGKAVKTFRTKAQKVLAYQAKHAKDPAKPGKAEGEKNEGPVKPGKAKGKKNKSRRFPCENCARYHQGGAAECNAPVCRKEGCGLGHFPQEGCWEARDRFIKAGLVSKGEEEEPARKATKKPAPSAAPDEKDTEKYGALFGYFKREEIGSVAALMKQEKYGILFDHLEPEHMGSLAAIIKVNRKRQAEEQSGPPPKRPKSPWSRPSVKRTTRRKPAGKKPASSGVGEL